VGVSKDPNALGYFGFSYFKDKQDQLKALAVDYGKVRIGFRKQCSLSPYRMQAISSVSVTSTEGNLELCLKEFPSPM